MIIKKLEIMIPTYNRANYLDYTLNSLLNSPFKDCKITVRDNASPDNTQEICEKYLPLFHNLKIIRNNKNIGGNANILRCYEEATFEYVWVLGDNDLLNFEDCDDFINAIESDKYELIICSSGIYPFTNNINATFDDEGLSELIMQNSDKPNYLENTSEELVSIIKNYYFSTASFISSFIYKTSLIDSTYLISGYNYISRSYPHFPLFVKALNENVLTYKTKKDVVLLQKNPDDAEVKPGLEFYARCLDCALLVEDKKFRKYASQLHAHGILYSIAGYMVFAKIYNEKNINYHILDLVNTLYKLKGLILGTFYFIFIILIYLIPKKLCTFVYNKRGKITSKIYKK